MLSILIFHKQVSRSSRKQQKKQDSYSSVTTSPAKFSLFLRITSSNEEVVVGLVSTTSLLLLDWSRTCFRAVSSWVGKARCSRFPPRIGLSAAVQFAREVLEDKGVRVVRLDESLFRNAVDSPEHHQDKDWSFTDYSSFVVMTAVGIREAFAFDADFAQAGFFMVP